MNGANILTVEGQTYAADITSYGKISSTSVH